jgi:hypothetical protein
MDFFAYITHVCSHFVFRKRAFSQSLPLKKLRNDGGRGFKSI